VGILPTRTRHVGKIQSRPCMRRQLTILLVTRLSCLQQKEPVTMAIGAVATGTVPRGM
jgi:hypothetical protein